jgi:glycosyltransferase involved in cell wall biosynthesis
VSDRLAIFTDYEYRRDESGVYAERAFVLFMASLRPWVERLVVVGRLQPELGRWNYRLPDDVEFVGLPHYRSLLDAPRALAALVRSLRRFWRALDDVDAVWLLGPYLQSIAFVALARLRRKRVALGVRQDLPRYVRSRHPARRWTHLAALVLEAAYRLLARRYPTVVVGPDLARRYRRARRLLELTVSLVRERDIVTDGRRDYDGRLQILSVGRVDREKNPLLLAEVLAQLRADDPRWRLVVCGDGPLRPALEERLRELGVAEHADLRGYVPIDRGLMDLYRESHALLHVSWTEGLPQVVFEAFAAGLPIVASAVGGIPAAVGDAALLVDPGDAGEASRALRRVADDAALRRGLVEDGLRRVGEHTLERESERLARFLAAG